MNRTYICRSVNSEANDFEVFITQMIEAPDAKSAFQRHLQLLAEQLYPNSSTDRADVTQLFVEERLAFFDDAAIPLTNEVYVFNFNNDDIFDHVVMRIA